MQHSTWDLEVHTREMQQRWLREADRARQLAAARQRGDRIEVPANRFRHVLEPRRSLSPSRNRG
ncbi:MAG: hypothetical protein K0S14_3460 [Thermomicrobiales bacterium]|nr:hypothetical protein [Thermomicrobiales bacterium]